jgi:hypothetical protein
MISGQGHFAFRREGELGTRGLLERGGGEFSGFALLRESDAAEGKHRPETSGRKAVLGFRATAPVIEALFADSTRLRRVI